MIPSSDSLVVVVGRRVLGFLILLAIEAPIRTAEADSVAVGLRAVTTSNLWSDSSAASIADLVL